MSAHQRRRPITAPVPDKLDRLQRALGLRFRDHSLLRTALTHRSAGSPHNERLEFLGDAILNCSIAETLYRRFPRAREGELTRLRSRLVRGETLARVARRLDIGDAMTMGSGELKSGGYRRDSVLEDALEAIIGAAFEDQGIDVTQALIRDLFAAELDGLEPGEQLKDPKTRLQEYLQSHSLPLPNYEQISADGPDHLRYYRVRCTVSVLAEPLYGDGRSRRNAEQTAAAAALAAIERQTGQTLADPQPRDADGSKP